MEFLPSWRTASDQTLQSELQTPKVDQVIFIINPSGLRTAQSGPCIARSIKVELETFDRLAELYDKSALPMAAALPAFLTFLAGEHVIVDPWRTKFLMLAYLFGGSV